MDHLNLSPPQSLIQNLELCVSNDHISSLTPDLLLHIFGYLREDGRSLCNYALVCRRWQKLLEPLIYNTIQVYNEAPTPPRAFSVVRFKHFVGGLNNVRRRAMVRKLVFHYQATQFPRGPGETASRAQDPAQNPTDAGFRKAVAGLFQTLRFWEPWYKIELDIALAYSYTGAPRLASMANPSTTADLVTFPTVHCVAEIAFHYSEHGQVFQRIWEATPFHIAQSCANLASLVMDSDAFKLTGRQAPVIRRRKVIAECLDGLPATIENFSMRVIGVSNPYVLDWFTPEEDPFSCKLLRITTHLHAIKLYNVTIPVDFWCPLDKNYRPKRDRPVWPCLTHILSDDNCLVEGTGKLVLVRLI
ncbi:predicted protein [Aspergillus nidulans FGSC A4]|uniref:F-box domain-containing protein n=1 Tax=Emericella nidulans (strain FGSC A4 / ATCC 38163 / CBS 112.46 / NRRL 194 / M139) TaxID=227321 RepID=Q5AS21_EMENI|nr:hypothetical protein [Aspergillus nidulans FGSC A4]EAA64123.1 predicted protein [Aspergillus nidulans FGSC A4]CBF84685.1 TPA: conserved hypothetical protein [Aspergillus nidulans FGSC A4]|eukprot:XP_682178.1 predicted protein [Aspergillus nidulans FGSC A4]